jgi:MscS family membrane protein
MINILSVLTATYFDNSLYIILLAAGIVIGGFFASKLLSKAIDIVVKPFTKKTKTDLDDLIVKIIETPINFFIILFSIYYAKTLLVLPQGLNAVFEKGYSIIMLIMIAFVGIKIIDLILYKILTKIALKTESEFDDHLVPIIRQAVGIVLFVIAILMIIDNFGFDITSIIAGLGIGGLAFALAAKDMLANLFGGVSVFLDKPFKPGEFIKTNGAEGTVVEIGLRTTRLKTLDNRIITIPNSKIADSMIENVTSEDARKIVLNLGLTYDTSVKKIKQAVEIVKKIVKDNKSTKDESLISFNKFGDFSLNLLVIYWIKDKSNILQAQHEINLDIKKQFEKAKIDFAFPTQTIIVNKGISK